MQNSIKLTKVLIYEQYKEKIKLQNQIKIICICIIIIIHNYLKIIISNKHYFHLWYAKVSIARGAVIMVFSRPFHKRQIHGCAKSEW
jgi:hypothetical protein